MKWQRKKNRTKEEKKLLLREIGFFLLVTILVSLCSTMITYAWISRNKIVKTNDVNMRYYVDSLSMGGVQIKDGVITLLDPDETLSTSPGEDIMIPGSTMRIKIGLANANQETQTITSVGFEDTAIWKNGDSVYKNINKDRYDEIPAQVDDQYYYLGTQLTIEVLQYTIYEYEQRQVMEGDEPKLDDNGNPVYQLVIIGNLSPTPVSLTKVEPVYLTSVSGSKVDYTKVIRDDLNINLASNHLIAFDVVVKFVETNEEQNAYKNFGAGDTKAKFSRTLAINVEKEQETE